MDESKFLLDTDENIGLIGLGDVALLLESPASLTMLKNVPFVKKVAKCLNWLASNVKSVGRTRALLMMMSNPALGMLTCT